MDKYCFRINSKRRAIERSRMSMTKSVSRNFNVVSDKRIEHLKQIQLKPKTEAEVNWGVNVYNEWRNNRLFTFRYDVGIYYADLNDLKSLTKENLNHSLCSFIPDVTKQRGEGPYPGHTLYQMIVAIQMHLNVNKLPWKLLEAGDSAFSDVRVVLDNVMKERTAMNVGVTKHQASVIMFEMENRLWESGVLGEENPEQLRNTVLFMPGMNVTLRTVDEHYNLRREMPSKVSQIQFERDPNGTKCLVYREDFVTKRHDGGINDRKTQRKEVWVYPNDENISRCTVCLVEKYLSLCPIYYKKKNFYLQSLQKPSPKQWYAEQVIGVHTISKITADLMKAAEIEGYFTNHSLRRSGGTRLFRAGVDRKLVKEFTGHRSDAVDQYQIHGFDQRKKISSIVQGLSNQEESSVSSNCSEKVEENNKNCNKSSRESMKVGETTCSCSKINASNVTDIVSELLKQTSKRGKTVITIEIEVQNE